MMKTGEPILLLWFFVLFSPTPSSAEFFQWTDSRGTIHLTDNLHSVPEEIRDSPGLMIRRDLEITGKFLETSIRPANMDEEPLSQSKPPEVTAPPEPELKTAAPPNINYSVQQTTIVVVNSVVHHPRKHSCPGSEGCQGVFRPNFEDRRFIHPSVFDGGTRQFIQPNVSPSSHR